MSIALIDNSTLSSVQRVLGHIPIRSNSIIDGDIVAFESLLNAILFYNDYIVLDDYQEQYSQKRKDQFPFIRFIRPAEFNDIDILKKTYSTTNSYQPKIESGNISDKLFSDMLTQLGMYIQCTWDLSQSVYYLNLKMLGNDDSEEKEKYRTLLYLMFSQLQENTNNSPKTPGKVSLVDRYGKPISSDYKIPYAKSANGKTGGLAKNLQTFIASLNWISFRSIYYTEFADYLKADTFLHPIRQKFQTSYFDQRNKFNADYIKGLINLFSSKTAECIKTLYQSNRNYNISFTTPLFIASFISKTADSKEIINYALECRNKKEFIDARAILGEINNYFENGDFEAASVKVQKILKSLTNVFNDIYRLYGISTMQGDCVSKTINSINAVLNTFQLPQIPESIKDTSFIAKIKKIFPKKSFSFIYKDLITELTNVSKLGEYHELITKNIKIEKGKAVYDPKFESPEFMNSHSWWKSPM